MKKYTGRPDDFESRSTKEIEVYDLLEELKIDFEGVDHKPIDNMEGFKEIDKVLDVTMCKNLFLTTANKKNFYLFLTTGDKKFVTKDFSKIIGSSRLSFAKSEYMEKYLGTVPGSASILGLMKDTENKVNLVIDSEVYEREYIGCHPLVNTSSIKIKTADIMDVFLKRTGHEAMIITI